MGRLHLQEICIMNKSEQRKKINKDIEKFLSKGGKIEKWEDKKNHPKPKHYIR